MQVIFKFYISIDVSCMYIFWTAQLSKMELIKNWSNQSVFSLLLLSHSFWNGLEQSLKYRKSAAYILSRNQTFRFTNSSLTQYWERPSHLCQEFLTESNSHKGLNTCMSKFLQVFWKAAGKKDDAFWFADFIKQTDMIRFVSFQSLRGNNFLPFWLITIFIYCFV